MHIKYFKAFIFLLSVPVITYAQEVGKPLPLWQEGEMEIHHISTGKGNAAFCIFPDGTNMLIDAGDNGPSTDPRFIPVIPNASKQAGEWIARYIANRMAYKKNKEIDYFLLSHFHEDHAGDVYTSSPKATNGGGYVLSGISEVGEYLSIKKAVTRDTGEYPVETGSKSVFDNYRKFIDWNVMHNGLKTEYFIPGVNTQFLLLNHPEKYKSKFEVRNIMANGDVWTKLGSNTKKYLPSLAQLNKEAIDENLLSAGVRITYGKFDYFTGGDITSRLSLNAPIWADMETPVADAVGPVEVCSANHHGWTDAMSDYFVSRTQSKAYVLQVNHITHINFNSIWSMSSKALYPGKRNIFPTVVPPLAVAYIGKGDANRLTGDGGHIVIKVKPGGQQFYVIALNDKDELFTVKAIYGPYECN